MSHDTPSPAQRSAPADEGMPWPYLRDKPLHEFTDVEQQDFVNALNSMMRAAIEHDEIAYDACYDRVQEMLDEHHAECSKVGGFRE